MFTFGCCTCETSFYVKILALEECVCVCVSSRNGLVSQYYRQTFNGKELIRLYPKGDSWKDKKETKHLTFPAVNIRHALYLTLDKPMSMCSVLGVSITLICQIPNKHWIDCFWFESRWYKRELCQKKIRHLNIWTRRIALTLALAILTIWGLVGWFWKKGEMRLIHNKN